MYGLAWCELHAVPERFVVITWDAKLTRSIWTSSPSVARFFSRNQLGTLYLHAFGRYVAGSKRDASISNAAAWPSIST